MLSSYCSHFRQSFSPFASVLLCFTVTSIFKNFPELSGLLLHIRWIDFIENGHHCLTKRPSALSNLHQLVQAPCRRSVVPGEQDLLLSMLLSMNVSIPLLLNSLRTWLRNFLRTSAPWKLGKTSCIQLRGKDEGLRAMKKIQLSSQVFLVLKKLHV